LNIFVLDEDPVISARHHCDKHVVKMILESCQMLCTAHHLSGGQAPYKPCFVNHPCTIWTRATLDNYNWLYTMCLELTKEFELRYHKTHRGSEVLKDLGTPDLPATVGLTPFAQAMPEVYKETCAVEAYRAYYKGEKAYFATWKTNTPSWWDV